MNKKKRKAKRELTKAYKERMNRQRTHNLLVEALSNEVKTIVTNYSQSLRELAKIFEK